MKPKVSIIIPCYKTEKTLSERFAKDFDKIKCFEDVHITPSGDNQNFVFCSFIRK